MLLELTDLFRDEKGNNNLTIEQSRDRQATVFSQTFENFMLPSLADWVSVLKEKLTQLERQGVDVQKLLSNVRIEFTKKNAGTSDI